MSQSNEYLLATLMLSGETLRALVAKGVISNQEALITIQNTQDRLTLAVDTTELGVQHHLENLKATFQK